VVKCASSRCTSPGACCACVLEAIQLAVINPRVLNCLHVLMSHHTKQSRGWLTFVFCRWLQLGTGVHAT
jgi:hypothetical protein